MVKVNFKQQRFVILCLIVMNESYYLVTDGKIVQTHCRGVVCSDFTDFAPQWMKIHVIARECQAAQLTARVSRSL